MKHLSKLSVITLISICAFVSVYRMSNVNNKEISWDVLGYYMCLPSTFIYNEPMLYNTDWLQKVNNEKQLSGTLYQVSSNEQGEPMYFFLFGMALFYLPFFFMGHGMAGALGYEMDGFSAPYQYALVAGCILYTIIGQIYFRKILKQYFSEGITALVMLLVMFGTNAVNHLTLKNLETVNILFMLVCIVVWNTIRWHQDQKTKNLFAIAVGITLITLVKPSEVFIILIPLLWNVTSVNGFIKKISLLLENKRGLLLTLTVCFLLVLPQMLYWHARTGHFIYDSYKNPGVGLDIFSPHILDVLFSYRKGWLLYTPVMLFALFGFYTLYKQNRNLFIAILAYFLVSFYIISSWTEWWYGAAFSCRPLIVTYPLLGICLGYFLVSVQKQKMYLRAAFVSIVSFFVFLNQFQWWQLKQYILDPYRTTKEYYWAIFLKTSVNAEDEKLKLINRDFSGAQIFSNKENYVRSTLILNTFDKEKNDNIRKDSTGNYYYSTLPDQEFCLTHEYTYSELTSKDHVWIRASADIQFPEKYTGTPSCIIMTMEYKGKAYGYWATDIQPDSFANGWHTYVSEFLTPEIRTRNDRFKCYIWKRSKSIVNIDNFKLEVFTPKDRK